jgi:hypothetical protein
VVHGGGWLYHGCGLAALPCRFVTNWQPGPLQRVQASWLAGEPPPAASPQPVLPAAPAASAPVAVTAEGLCIRVVL